jgi:PAS domain S-box-containing protein
VETRRLRHRACKSAKVTQSPAQPIAAKIARVGIYQSDAQGRCVYVNAALCELFGMSEKDALGLGWLDRVHPEDRAHVEAARKHAVTPVPVFHIEYRLLLNGRIIWVASFSTALMEGATFKGRIGTITDITEAKKHFPDEDSGSG